MPCGSPSDSVPKWCARPPSSSAADRSAARQLIVNGPGTCVPLCYAALLMQVLYIQTCKIIFVESFCRVDTLSLSGKLVYPIAARFIVQWPQLQRDWPKAEYIGRLL
jgi:beta-1,4-N-acetylglucosaminyltransferase